MSKHTPGPWRVDREHSLSVLAGERWICGEIDNDPSETEDWFGVTLPLSARERFDLGAENEANACLMAAAPDMYEELAHLVRLLEPLENDGTLNVPGLATLNGARAALAKARGE